MARHEMRARTGRVVPGRYPGGPRVLDLAAIEREVLGRWQARSVIERSIAANRAGQPWTFAGALPAATGMPGVHQVPDLVLRDLYQRFKAMQGFAVARLDGWSCHGLAVEVAVERELGLRGRADIESYGIARFTARCRESALQHIGAHSALAERVGHWAVTGAARTTMDPGHVEAVWACVGRIFDAGLLAREERIAPYCPRCQTGLSAHELARPASSRVVTEHTATVRFPLVSAPNDWSSSLSGADLLAATPAPWTLPANAAIAVHPHLTYAVARQAGSGDRVVVADAAVGRVLGDGWHIVGRLSGADLAGLGYRPPFSV